MSITPAILAQLPLPDIDVVLFYKRDEITTDLICCDVEIAGRTWTFHEETKGWENLISYLSALPNFRADWYAAVVKQPFATCETIAFDRRRGTQFSGIDGFPKNRQFGCKKFRILTVVLIAFIFGISAGWAVRGFIASDGCLDRGGAWDADLSACNLQKGNGR